MSIYQIIEAIAATPKRTEKESILTENKDNELLKRVFQVTYDPKINFYIRKIPGYTVGNGPVKVTLDTAINHVMHNLATRTLTGGAAETFLEALLECMDHEDEIILERIIKRDLRCGASDSSANKIWPGLVPEYPVMLCQPDKEKTRAKIRFPAFAQLKSDGMRVNAIVYQNGEVEYLARSGKSVNCNSPDLDAECIRIASELGEDDWVLDGELLWMEDGVISPREIGNGKCNKATRGEMSPEDRDHFVISVWDAIPLGVRDQQHSSYRYSVRYMNLKAAIESNPTKFDSSKIPRVNLIPTKKVINWNEASQWFDEVLAEGQEGLIIKNMDHLWVNDRSKECVKMKAEIENDFIITGWNEGEGKYAGKIGSLTMETADGGVKFNCAGMVDAIRNLDPETLMGKIAAVKYNMIMPSKNGAPRSVFLPRLIEVREDKTKADVL